MILRDLKYFSNVTKYDRSKLQPVHIFGTSKTCSTIIFEALLVAMFSEVEGFDEICGSVSPFVEVQWPAGI